VHCKVKKLETFKYVLPYALIYSVDDSYFGEHQTFKQVLEASVIFLVHFRVSNSYRFQTMSSSIIYSLKFNIFDLKLHFL